jgi:type II secretory pathway pseudopilin PulG
MTFPTDKRFHHNGGVTLMELTVAVVLTSIVIAIIYVSWNRLTFYTTTQKRRSALTSECNRLTDMLVTQLNKAHTVIRWSHYDIIFVVAGSEDTLNYSFDGYQLRCNDKPVPLLLHGSTVAAFMVDELNNDNSSKPYLFSLSLTCVTAQGDTASAQSTVMVKRPYGDARNSDFMW